MEHERELYEIWSNQQVDFDELFFLISRLQDAYRLRHAGPSDRVEEAFAAFKRFVQAGFTARDAMQAIIDEVENSLSAANDN